MIVFLHDIVESQILDKNMLLLLMEFQADGNFVSLLMELFRICF